MKLLSTLAATAGLCVAVPALSATVTLDFEGQESFASINIPANQYGIAANGALLALVNDGFGSGLNGENFSNEPVSGSSVMFATQSLPGERAEISSTSGFNQSVSFYYSSSAAGSVVARDASGAVVGQFDFAANSTNPDHPFNAWNIGTFLINGLAKSIDFSGAYVDGVGIAAFDNLTVNAVPLPGALLLLPSGLAMLGMMRRRKMV